MSLSLAVIDAFAERPYAGNPAAICMMTEMLTDQALWRIAAEMNLSETAFLLPEHDHWRLRWFTPTAEVDLCGHATLAAAHWLVETGRAAAGDQIAFHTRSGLLTATVGRDGVTLDFPAEPVAAADPPPELLQALGLDRSQVRFVGRNRFDYLLELADETTVRNLTPDMDRLATVETRGIMATARSDEPARDFVSRFFAPAVGIPEDPVTGSAHCALGPYWQQTIGKEELIGYQASSRGGSVRVRPIGDRVALIGHAFTIWTGTLRILP